jgi:nifR3 family TIM-barrel protein
MELDQPNSNNQNHVGRPLLPSDAHGCPYLQLAPMEGVGDRCFRKAMATIGGFDEAVRDFLRVPRNAHIKSLASEYHADELAPIPLAAQLMGSDPDLMGEMAQEIERRKAPRIDLNCGCPSNTVTGRGAGSSLLKEPNFLHQVAKAVVEAVSIPVTLKMRSGYEDISLFRENLFAAQESGISYLTLHPRTKVDGYGPPARWDLIAEAKSILKIPVVGNGDILNVEDALRMLKMTKCDALMIGRGSIINPFIFHQIRAHFSGKQYQPSWEDLVQYFNVYLAEMPSKVTIKTQVNKLKQLSGFLFKGNAALLDRRQAMLTAAYPDPEVFIRDVLPTLKEALWQNR